MIAGYDGLLSWLLAEEHADDQVRRLSALLAGCVRAGCLDGTDNAHLALDLAAHVGAHLPGGVLPRWTRSALTIAEIRWRADVWPRCPCCRGSFEATVNGPLYCHPCRAYLLADGTFKHHAGIELAHRHPRPWPREEQAA